MLTFHLWMPFLLTPAIQNTLHYRESTWNWAKQKRLLSKRSRETWNQNFHVILHMRTCDLYLLKRDEQKINEEISFYLGEPICIGFVPLFIMLVSLVCIPLFEPCHTSIMEPNKHNPPGFRMSLL